MRRGRQEPDPDTLVHVDTEGVSLEGNLVIPEGAQGVVLFAHGSGSSRFSPRNRFVAGELQAGGLATLLIDLLTADEEQIDMRTRELRFDIDLLSRRLVGAVDWLQQHPEAGRLAIGTFGSSTGAAAALNAATTRPDVVKAVVSRGGRPDMAATPGNVEAPTLLIVGGRDTEVVELNKLAMSKMRGNVELEIVPGATHLFEEPGTLERVAELARAWFRRYLG